MFGGLSVLDNVVIARLPEYSIWRAWFAGRHRRAELWQAREEARYWLEYVGLADQQARLARELSFGQQKLLSLARLFAH